MERVLIGKWLYKFHHYLIGEFDAAAGKFQGAVFVGYEFAVRKILYLFLEDLFVLGRQLNAFCFSKTEVNALAELLDPVERIGGDQFPGLVDMGALCCALIGEAAVTVGARA